MEQLFEAFSKLDKSEKVKKIEDEIIEFNYYIEKLCSDINVKCIEMPNKRSLYSYEENMDSNYLDNLYKTIVIMKENFGVYIENISDDFY